MMSLEESAAVQALSTHALACLALSELPSDEFNARLTGFKSIAQRDAYQALDIIAVNRK